MAKIEIYARLRPTKNRFPGLKTSHSHVSVQIGENDDVANSSKFTRAPGVRRDFKYTKTFEENSNQEEIFETVARKIVDRFVDGYNGTVFAYGQTSTGKTYTVEGSARQYEERGLIPRTLSYLYGILEEKKVAFTKQSSTQNVAETPNSDHSHTHTSEGDEIIDDRMRETKEGIIESPEVKVHISYMEIYQDTGFDLLNPGTRPGSLMLTLPKVQISEGADGKVTVRDLSIHEAANEQVAISLLFQGSTCRKVAETVMNQSSSRSHTIFTITMTTKQPGSEVILRSKLHLVDLAGSERVSKTGSDGRILQEAKFINLSLHHLEHVIVSLQQARSGSSIERGRRRVHIPYRNSMLTMVLRDSLGGNCLTAMIATVSADEVNICETISTLRFSQRVACVSNTASRNELLDDKVVIKKLKKKVTELERELLTLREKRHLSPSSAMASSDGDRSVMSEVEKRLCHQVLYDFFHGRVSNPVEAGINTPALFQECLHVLRDIVIDAVKSNNNSNSSNSIVPTSGAIQQPSLQNSTISNKEHLHRYNVPTSTVRDSRECVEAAQTSPVVVAGGDETRSRSKRQRRRKTKTHKHDRSTNHSSSTELCSMNEAAISSQILSPTKVSPHNISEVTCSPATTSPVATVSSSLSYYTPPSPLKKSEVSSSLMESFSGHRTLKLSPSVPLHPHTVTSSSPAALASQSHSVTSSPISHPHTSHSHITQHTSPPISHPHTSTPISHHHMSHSHITQHTSPPISHPHTPTYSNHQGIHYTPSPISHTQNSSFSNPPPLKLSPSIPLHAHTITSSQSHPVSSPMSHPHISTHTNWHTVHSTPSPISHPHTSQHTPPPISHTHTSQHTPPPISLPHSSTVSTHTPSPIPTSQLSSGIGSLHDEEDERERESLEQSSSHQPSTWAKRVMHNHSVPKNNSCCHGDTRKQDQQVSPETEIKHKGREEFDKDKSQLNLRDEKQEIRSNVKMLSLHVEEEELSAQLKHIAECLATQHARVLSYQHHQQQQESVRNGENTSSVHHDKLSMEMIAQQQLRIKQARLHQKYLTIQQQLKSLKTLPHNSRTSNSSATISMPTTRSPPPIVDSVPVIVKRPVTVTHQDAKVHVESELEQLRASQIEKQLELKEAATKRKIQELKQHFMKKSPSNSHSQSIIQSRAQNLVPENVPEKPPPSTVPEKTKCAPQMKQDTSRSNLLIESKNLTTELVKYSTWTNIVDERMTMIDHKHMKKESSLNNNCSKVIQHHDKKKEEDDVAMTTMSCRPREQVSVNERVYMKVATSQRQRVVRIRRCIAAANTIQKAWRKHRDHMTVT